MIITLELDKYYHVYNRGINSCNLFNNGHDFDYFLKLYKKHLGQVTETYAITLMSNHFHLVIKFNDDIQKLPHQYLSNLFNAYTKAFNLWNNRHGSLFERPFRRKLIQDEEYLTNAICYVNCNPIKHSVVKKLEKYKWCSYHMMINGNDEIIDISKVYEFFRGKDNFIERHERFASGKMGGLP